MERDKDSELIYTDMASKVGKIRVVATRRGLAAVLWEGEDYTRTKLSTPYRDDQAPLLQLAKQQLLEYLTGREQFLIYHWICTEPPFSLKYGTLYWIFLLVKQRPMVS